MWLSVCEKIHEAERELIKNSTPILLSNRVKLHFSSYSVKTLHIFFLYLYFCIFLSKSDENTHNDMAQKYAK